ncbi:cation efflux protein [Flammula alnicola]|nr:cation efflux protein [Flammula alnicola]
MSRSSRITLLLIIDLCFFLVELIVGYAVGSLALVADSFHMLNDVMSLFVALYAIKLTNGATSDSRYSYGWHRAEILAALINGVFLLALCFSISLEAIGRFFTTPDISSPKLVVIVGSLGLASNVVGLFLFHEHGHAHPPPRKSPSSSSRASSVAVSSSQDSLVPGDVTPTQKKSTHDRQSEHVSTESFSSLYGHPAATRASLVQTAQDIASARSPSPIRTRRDSIAHGRLSIDSIMTPSIGGVADTPLLADAHDGHGHGHGHAHGSMNMRALLLHVLGDALGNVGVIATGLIIWQTTWKYRFYCDPVISLVITVIIFSSALPLVQSASFILLQVKDSILDVEGVLSLHELHVWQLSENKLVASVHTTEDSSCLILCPADEACNPSENACCPPSSEV